MKEIYPKYERGSTAELKSKLKGKQKKIFEDYMAFLRQTSGERKMVDYQMYFLQFIDIIQKPLNKLKPQDFVNFWGLVNQDTTREVNTKNHIKRTVKRFLKWYYCDDLIMLRTADQLRLKHQLVNKKRINKQSLVSERELARMLRATQSIMLKAQLKVLYNCAMRPEELRKAKWSSIDWDKQTIHIISSKTGNPRELPLGDSIDHLRRWKNEFCYEDVTDDDFIFPSPRDRTKPYHEWTFRYNVEKLGKLAGIKRTVYPYLLRHSRLNFLRTKGVDTKTRSLFAGHSLKMAEGVYTHMDDFDMIKEITKKIYHVEELTKEQQNKYDKVISYLSDKVRLHDLQFEKLMRIVTKSFNKIKGEEILSVIKKKKQGL